MLQTITIYIILLLNPPSRRSHSGFTLGWAFGHTILAHAPLISSTYFKIRQTFTHFSCCIIHTCQPDRSQMTEICPIDNARCAFRHNTRVTHSVTVRNKQEAFTLNCYCRFMNRSEIILSEGKLFQNGGAYHRGTGIQTTRLKEMDHNFTASKTLDVDWKDNALVGMK